MTLSPRLITAVLGALLTFATAACSEPAETAATATTAPAATPTSPGPASSPSVAVAQWKNAVYKVGDQIQAGNYKTTGDKSSCYWNRLKDDTGKSDAIIARDIFDGPKTMTVEATDAFIKFGGGCIWTRA